MENIIEIKAEKLTDKEQFLIRKQIVNLRLKGMSKAKTAEALSVSESHVSGTWGRYKKYGIKGIALKIRGRSIGEKRRLTPIQEKEIQKIIIDKCPEQLKLPGFLWDRKNICSLVKDKYDIDMPKSTIGVYLKRWGFTPQRPIKRNYKQQPEQIKKWLEEDYPKIEEQCKNENGEIFWGDETGVHNETNYVKSYAPKGKTPVMEIDSSKVKINMMSAITNQGKVRFMLYEESMNQQNLIIFLKRLVKGSSKKVFLILDNLSVHHGKLVKSYLKDKKDKIELFYLPSYAPEYNPDEYLNGNLKRNIASKKHAHSVKEIRKNTENFMRELQRKSDHVKSYFRHEKITYCADTSI